MRRTAAALVLAGTAWSALGAAATARTPAPGDDPVLRIADQRFAVTRARNGRRASSSSIPTVPSTASSRHRRAAAARRPRRPRARRRRRRARRARRHRHRRRGQRDRRPRSPVDDRAELAAALDPDGQDDLTTTDEVVVAVASVLSRGDEDVLDLRIPIAARSDPGSLAVRAAGIYPVVVTVAVEGDVLAAPPRSSRSSTRTPPTTRRSASP